MHLFQIKLKILKKHLILILQLRFLKKNTAASETEVGDNLTDDLPISHSYAEEDQKMKQELQDVDHGDLETKQHAQTKNANYQKPQLIC